jgi:aldehyde:ferredoxin oxidoreductase
VGIPDGYGGKLLIIDLTHKSIVQEELQVDDVRRFIGGSGLGAKILFQETDETTDPLGSENVLIYLTGPFTNSPVPASGRHAIVGKSPLTGIWGESDV